MVEAKESEGGVCGLACDFEKTHDSPKIDQRDWGLHAGMVGKPATSGVGPLHTWASVAPQTSFIELPLYVIMGLSWILRGLEKGAFIEVRRESTTAAEGSRTDAYAAGKDIGLGCWAPVAPVEGKAATMGAKNGLQ